MGTNYYLYPKPRCETCGRGYEGLHIGKSSAGWCFSLHVIPEEGINDLEDWKARWSSPGTYIEDEYGKVLSTDEMLETITERSHKEMWDELPTFPSSWEQFHRENHSERGPNGLLRHRIEPRHCIKQGEGTWDCIVGEFS